MFIANKTVIWFHSLFPLILLLLIHITMLIVEWKIIITGITALKIFVMDSCQQETLLQSNNRPCKLFHVIKRVTASYL